MSSAKRNFRSVSSFVKGDAWGWSDNPEYPAERANLAYRIAVNYFVYDLSH